MGGSARGASPRLRVGARGEYARQIEKGHQRPVQIGFATRVGADGRCSGLELVAADLPHLAHRIDGNGKRSLSDLNHDDTRSDVTGLETRACAGQGTDIKRGDGS